MILVSRINFHRDRDSCCWFQLAVALYDVIEMLCVWNIYTGVMVTLTVFFDDAFCFRGATEPVIHCFSQRFVFLFTERIG